MNDMKASQIVVLSPVSSMLRSATQQGSKYLRLSKKVKRLGIVHRSSPMLSRRR